MTQNEKFMKEALKQAKKAAQKGEVPIGAVIVKDGKIIARAHNLKESNHDVAGHAEMIAIRKASKKLESWRLTGCQIFVTIEPCMMCAGALYQSRIDKVVYGAPDPKAGALESLYNVGSDDRLNHRFEVSGGLLQEECSAVIKDFFKLKR